MIIKEQKIRFWNKKMPNFCRMRKKDCGNQCKIRNSSHSTNEISRETHNSHAFVCLFGSEISLKKWGQNTLLAMCLELDGQQGCAGERYPRQATETIEGQQGSLIPKNVPIQTPEVSEEVVKTSALPQNINQNTGLTHIEEALLSNEEKAMRLRQRGMTA